MINWIIFNGKSLKDFGVYISGSGTYNAAARDVEVIEIPGRNGTLTRDKGRYKSVLLSYPAFIIRNFDNNVSALRNWLLTQHGNVRLEDTYHPEEFRLARFSDEFSTEPVDELYAGNFTMTFECQPQRFLKDGEKVREFTAASNTLLNEQLTTALPLIRAYGTGYFTINGIKVTINTADSYTDIDCDLQEAYKDTLATNCNGNITLNDGEFPKLTPGNNTIAISGLSKLEIKPRWWIL